MALQAQRVDKAVKAAENPKVTEAALPGSPGTVVNSIDAIRVAQNKLGNVVQAAPPEMEVTVGPPEEIGRRTRDRVNEGKLFI